MTKLKDTLIPLHTYDKDALSYDKDRIGLVKLEDVPLGLRVVMVRPETPAVSYENANVLVERQKDRWVLYVHPGGSQYHTGDLLARVLFHDDGRVVLETHDCEGNFDNEVR